MAFDLPFLEQLERSPARVDELDDAIAFRHVPIAAALWTETAAVLAAERLHRDRDLDTFLDDRGDGNDRLVVVVRIEVILVEREFRLGDRRSEEHTSELQSRRDLVCRLL